MKHTTWTVGILLLIVLAMGTSGCYTLNAIGTPSDATLSMSNKPGGTMVKHFMSTMKVHHAIYGLVAFGEPDIAKALSDEIKVGGGTNAINIKFQYQMTFVDGLINAITFGIYNPFTLTIEGDIVK